MPSKAKKVCYLVSSALTLIAIICGYILKGELWHWIVVAGLSLVMLVMNIKLVVEPKKEEKPEEK